MRVSGGGACGGLGGRGGFSYVEVMVASGVLSVLVVSGLVLFGNLGRSRHDTLEREFAEHLAVDMIEEIKEQHYGDPVNGGFGLGGDENTGTRALFDDVDDYHNWWASPPELRDGTEAPGAEGLRRSVRVRWVQAGDPTQGAGSDQGLKEVRIRVDRGPRRLVEQVYIIPDAPLGRW